MSLVSSAGGVFLSIRASRFSHTTPRERRKDRRKVHKRIMHNKTPKTAPRAVTKPKGSFVIRRAGERNALCVDPFLFERQNGR